MPIIDFAILTGLTEEFEVLRAIFPQFQEHSENADIWYRTRVKSKTGKNYEIVAAFQNEMGPLDAHDLTLKVIERWEPAYIILVGIAGSFHKEVKLGDVLVSQQIFFYDPGKATPKGIQYRPQGYPCSTVLIRQTEALRLDKEVFSAWQEAARESAAKKAEQLVGKNQERVQAARKVLLANQPEIHFGTVASGSLVIADKRKQKELLAIHGKIIGTEMEGAGVLHATYRQELPTAAVVIKGISDAADKDKAHVDAKVHWRELAKENPVRLLLELICRGLIRPLLTDQFILDPTPGSPADARAMILDVSAPGFVSYQAFPRLVVPKGPLTELQIGIDVHGQSGTLDIIKLVVQYHDREGNQKTETLADMPWKIHLRQPILAAPVGVYTMVRGTPAWMTFTVASPSSEQKTKWFPLTGRR